MSLYNFVHLPMRVPNAMRIPEAKVVMDKEWSIFLKSASVACLQSKRQKET